MSELSELEALGVRITELENARTALVREQSVVEAQWKAATAELHLAEGTASYAEAREAMPTDLPGLQQALYVARTTTAATRAVLTREQARVAYLAEQVGISLSELDDRLKAGGRL